MMICSGLLLLTASGAAFAHPRIRNIEHEIPDALPVGDEASEAGATRAAETQAEPSL